MRNVLLAVTIIFSAIGCDAYQKSKEGIDDLKEENQSLWTQIFQLQETLKMHQEEEPSNRFLLYLSPLNARDVWMLDTRDGKIYQRVTDTERVGNPTFWDEQYVFQNKEGVPFDAMFPTYEDKKTLDKMRAENNERYLSALKAAQEKYNSEYPSTPAVRLMFLEAKRQNRINVLMGKETLTTTEEQELSGYLSDKKDLTEAEKAKKQSLLKSLIFSDPDSGNSPAVKESQN